MPVWLATGATVVYALLLSGWFGCLVYSVTVLQPHAEEEPETFERVARIIADGARYQVLAVIAGMTITGSVLIVDAVLHNRSTAFLVLCGIQIAAFGCACSAFAHLSWRVWPRRVFALPHELPAIRREFLMTSIVILSALGTLIAFGVITHLTSSRP